MKKILSLTLVLVAIATVSFSQTNIFPADGNTGIGTNSPSEHLEISNTSGGILRLSNSTTSVGIGSIAGKINFYKSDVSYGAGVVSYIQSRSYDHGGSYALDFATGDFGGG